MKLGIIAVGLGLVLGSGTVFAQGMGCTTQKSAEGSPLLAGQKAAEGSPTVNGQKAAEGSPLLAGQKAAEGSPTPMPCKG